MSDEGKSRLHAMIEGRVQGVSFRYFVVEHAHNLNIQGWVRNTWNGQVEVTAEGTRQNLENLLSVLHQGPPMAMVAEVNVEWQPYMGEFNDFRIKSSSS